MFDFSFSELALVAVVALVVLGPEKLPRVARTAGHLLGRARTYANQVKADIDREMHLEELRKLQQEAQDAARSFETSVNQFGREVESEAAKLEQTFAQGVGSASADDDPLATSIEEQARKAHARTGVPGRDRPLLDSPLAPAWQSAAVASSEDTEGAASSISSRAGSVLGEPWPLPVRRTPTPPDSAERQTVQSAQP